MQLTKQANIENAVKLARSLSTACIQRRCRRPVKTMHLPFPFIIRRECIVVTIAPRVLTPSLFELSCYNRRRM